MARSLVFLNVFFHACVVAFIGNELYALLFRDALPIYLSSLVFYGVCIRLLVIISSILCIVGLARVTKWGRKATIYWNLVLVFFIVGVPFAVAILVTYLAGGNVTDYLSSAMNRLVLLVGAVAFLVMAAALQARPVKEYFDARA